MNTQSSRETHRGWCRLDKPLTAAGSRRWADTGGGPSGHSGQAGWPGDRPRTTRSPHGTDHSTPSLHGVHLPGLSPQGPLHLACRQTRIFLYALILTLSSHSLWMCVWTQAKSVPCPAVLQPERPREGADRAPPVSPASKHRHSGLSGAFMESAPLP